MNQIFIDTRYSYSVSKKSGKYNGGNSYTKKMVSMVSELFPSYQILLICDKDTIGRMDGFLHCDLACVEALTDLSATDRDVYFNPHVEDTKRFSKELAQFAVDHPQTKICLTIHDRRHMESKYNRYDGILKEGIKSSSVLFSLGRKIKGIQTDAALKKIIAQADQIFTVSNYSMQQILKINPEASVKYYIQPISVSEVSSEDRYKGSILFVSAGRPEKNFLRALLAFEKYIQGSGNDTVQMIATGIHPFQTEKIKKRRVIDPEILEKRVILYEYIDQDALDQLYNTCRFLLFPSKNEGFGIPVAEAILHGMPVIVGNRSAIPEVAGSAAVYVDPNSEMSIIQGINYMMNEDYYRIMLDMVKRKRQILIEQMDLDAKMFIQDLVW